MTVAPGSKTTYAEMMSTAKEKICLQESGITDLRVKRSITGGLILEIPGENKTEKANNLVSLLRDVFEKGEEIKISRSYK